MIDTRRDVNNNPCSGCSDAEISFLVISVSLLLKHQQSCGWMGRVWLSDVDFLQRVSIAVSAVLAIVNLSDRLSVTVRY